MLAASSETLAWAWLGLLATVLLCACMGTAERRLRLKPVPFTQVRLVGGFWARRQEVNRTVTVPHCLRECEDTARIRNFEVAAGLAEGGFEGIYFNDSDVHKVIEGIAHCLALQPDPELDARLDSLIATIAAAQQPDGYLNTYFTLVEPDQRWTDLPVKHELYIAGHLFEAAVAHHQATGKRNLLDVAIRFADYIDSLFGEDEAKRIGVCGHEEIELALVKLYEATGEERYFRLARFFIDHRGYGGHEYCQDHLPVREQREVVGHAVRAMYLYTAMADVALQTGDGGLIDALDGLWEDLTTRRMYITGGIGPSAQNEGFTSAYDLPNDTAYAETCAAIGLVLWSHRMTLLHGRVEYADVVERALYNGVLAGVSMAGDAFFYVNPLASRGAHHRQPWFGCACCPPNVLRLIPQVGGFMYGTSEGGVYVNLYASGQATVTMGGRRIVLTQKTRYPWDGRIRLTVSPEAPTVFDLNLRIPGWCEKASLEVNGEACDATPAADGYVRLSRTWQTGDVVKLKLDMPVRRMAAHPNVAADVGRIALMRGPLVYCVEAADNDGSVLDLALPRRAKLKAEWRPELLGGVVAIRGKGLRREPDGPAALYRPAAEDPETAITAVPYYAWDHRTPGEMAVWIPEITALAEAHSRSGG